MKPYLVIYQSNKNYIFINEIDYNKFYHQPNVVAYAWVELLGIRKE